MPRHRLQMDLTDDEYAKLRQVARGRPVADVVRRAFSTEVYLDRRTQEGARVLIEEPDGQTRELIRP